MEFKKVLGRVKSQEESVRLKPSSSHLQIGCQGFEFFDHMIIYEEFFKFLYFKSGLATWSSILSATWSSSTL